MRKQIYLLGILVIAIFLTISCTKESANDNPSKNIAFLTTEPGGCNLGDFESLKSTDVEYQDTVMVSFRFDTLDIQVGINYICCANFESDVDVSNDSIIMTVTDMCPNPYQDCYCRCMCYYTWDFLFNDFEQKEYNIKVILNDPRQEEPIIFREFKISIIAQNK